MGEERDKKPELRPEELDVDAEKPRDLEVTGDEGEEVKGGLPSRGGETDDLEIQR
jgi:hypothetical protein